MTEQRPAPRSSFWQSIGRLPGILQAAAFFYCVIDPETPWTVKGAGIFALLYLMLPIDLIPDFLIILFGLGALDDIAVIYMAYNFGQSHIRPRHREKAEAFFGLD